MRLRLRSAANCFQPESKALRPATALLRDNSDLADVDSRKHGFICS
jgi:hypothetical protein